MKKKTALFCCLMTAALICAMILPRARAEEDVITAAFDAETNTITVEAEDVDGDFAILFHPALADVSRPVTVRAGDAVRTVRVNPSEEFLKASILENGDPALACVGRIMYSEVVSPEGSME